MKIVVAKRTSRRGQGLGNELLPWAKGWIASQELHAHLVGPSWGLNKRRYARNFGTNKLDWILEDAILRLPHFCFRDEDYRATGESDFGAAIRHWAQERRLDRRRSFLVEVGGMWGGYTAIRYARPFLWSQLLSSRDALRNLYRVLSKLDRNKLAVAVHLRSGGDGFMSPVDASSQRGRFNILIASDWYLWVCEQIAKEFGDRVQFWFFTDRQESSFEKLSRRFNPRQFAQTGLTECSDLLLMAMADVRVCSVSSYSMAACFLADGPYVWYEPQLTLRDGLYTLWGGEETQQLSLSPTMHSRAFVEDRCGSCHQDQNGSAEYKGYPMDIGDALPECLAVELERHLRAKESRTNLLEYGCVRQNASRTNAETVLNLAPMEGAR